MTASDRVDRKHQSTDIPSSSLNAARPGLSNPGAMVRGARPIGCDATLMAIMVAVGAFAPD